MNFKRITGSFLLSFLLCLSVTSFVISGCGGAGGGSDSPVFTKGSSDQQANDTPNSRKSWTLLIYMAGDNDLSSAIDYNIKQLETIGSNTNLNIVVFADRPSENTKVYYIKKDNSGSEFVTSPYTDYGSNLNSGDLNVLKNFTVKACTDYPADNYMLIIWNHGAGIREKCSTKGVCWDETSGTHLSIPDLTTALKTVANTYQMKIVAFDACFMGMMEVGYNLKSICGVQYIVGSQLTVPGEGFPYNGSWLSGITQSTQPETVCINLVNDYFNLYNGNDTASLSAINVAKFFNTSSGPIKYFDSLASNLANTDITNTTQLTVISSSVIPQVQACSGNFSDPYYDYRDIYDFCNKLAGNSTMPPSVISDANSLKALLTIGPGQSIVTAKACSSNAQFNISNLYGISCLLVQQNIRSYSYWSQYYNTLDYYNDHKTNGWPSFLQRVNP